MICNNCKNKSICKNYDYLINHKELNVDRCDLFVSSVLNISDFTKKINNPIDAYANIKKPFNITPLDIELRSNKKEIIKCPACKITTFKDDIKECVKCGKKTCSNCGIDIFEPTEENDTTIRYCNECYGIDEENNNDNPHSTFKDLLNNTLFFNEKEGE